MCGTHYIHLEDPSPPPPPQVTGELLDEAMERMLLTDPHSADCLFRMRCEVPG